MTYAREMADRLPPTLRLPDEFHALFDWIEANGFFMPSGAYPCDQLGLLGREDDVQSGRVTSILFRVATPEQAREYSQSWLGAAVPDIEDRLVPFARTGGDGSHVAFWLDDDGRQWVVHLGSEGLTCVLGRTSLDFLRLLAVGYEEISGDCLDAPDEPPTQAGRNAAYRAWLTERYRVTIPKTAADILDELADVSAKTSDDPFERWVQRSQNAAT
jgi:hypothetical protein